MELFIVAVCMYVFDLNPFIYKETFAFYLYFINFWKGSIQHLSSLTAFFHLFLNISSSAYERLLTCKKIDIYNKLTGLICEEVHIWDLRKFCETAYSISKIKRSIGRLDLKNVFSPVWNLINDCQESITAYFLVHIEKKHTLSWESLLTSIIVCKSSS